jgi:branched-chain amino acid transport system substrate-binding protein
MITVRRILATTCWASLLFSVNPAVGQTSEDSVNLAVLTDMSGALASASGPGSVIAAQMAIEDHGGRVLGKPIILKTGDHQNKPDIALSLARRWIDTEKVVALFDLANSAVAFGVQNLGKEKNVITVVTTAGATDLTGKACSETGFHWVYNNYSSANALAHSVASLNKDKWFFITSDYAFGHSLEAEMSAVIQAANGKVVGSVKVPLNTADMSSFLLHALTSKTDVVVLATAGSDTVTALKQSDEFGLSKKAILIIPVMFTDAVKAVGLKVGQGLRYASAYDWNLNEPSRAWAQRFYDRHRAMPTQSHAGVYSAMRHYLNAVAAVGTTESKAVASRMRNLPIKDTFTDSGTLRADGLLQHDMYVMEIKRPDQSSGEWDIYQQVQTIPANVAFPPIEASACPLVRR